MKRDFQLEWVRRSPAERERDAARFLLLAQSKLQQALDVAEIAADALHQLCDVRTGLALLQAARVAFSVPEAFGRKGGGP